MNRRLQITVMVIVILMQGCSSGNSGTATPAVSGYGLTLIAGAINGPAGTADGTGSKAYFNNPTGIVVDSGDTIYVADTDNDDLRTISLQGVVATWAGKALNSGSSNGTGTAAAFNHPHGLAIDQSGSVYVADTGNNVIRKITPDAVVTTLAGTAGGGGSADGTGSAAAFNGPLGVVVDSNGNVYVTDSLNSTIRKITPAGVVTTVAGHAGVFGYADGTGTAAQFNEPEGIAIDALGNLYIADTLNHVIRKMTPAGVVTTVAGLNTRPGSLDGSTTVAELDQPVALAVNDSGALLVLDKNAQTLRKISNGMVTTLLAATTTNSGVLWSVLPVPLALALNVQQQPVFVSSFGIFQGTGF